MCQKLRGLMLPTAPDPENAILPRKNDIKYHERRKYEEIIWCKAEIFIPS